MYEHSNKDSGFILGVDVGGSHISSALVRVQNGEVLQNSFCRRRVDSRSASSRLIIDQWADALQQSLSALDGQSLHGIGIAMPGPFDYKNGISLIKGLDKYQALYGINIKAALESGLELQNIPIVFENDAACFGIGESLAEKGNKTIALTLGTGLGATFIHNGRPAKPSEEIPTGGVLFNTPFKAGLAEDYISTRGLIKAYAERCGRTLQEVKKIAELATVDKEEAALQVFQSFADDIADCLAPWINSFRADLLVIGGSIAMLTIFSFRA
jgi:predicted NBD/HSP70 family sugar kinase